MLETISIKIPQITLDYLTDLGFDKRRIIDLYSHAINELIDYSIRQIEIFPPIAESSCLLGICDYIYNFLTYNDYYNIIDAPIKISDVVYSELIEHSKIILNNLENDLWLNHYVIYGNERHEVRDLIENHLIIKFLKE